ncbi:hypothetical protein RISK_002397 [Rhodopirellula islandica]|uniref:Uncharacterized protein n=1 Tax=Rhodopirellula islandica TaxID=595434 RepID=A0A0J1BGU5_RHOIS|nr:hypothetical protein RISK_002397 [Rhodopirellula islandica]
MCDRNARFVLEATWVWRRVMPDLRLSGAWQFVSIVDAESQA